MFEEMKEEIIDSLKGTMKHLIKSIIKDATREILKEIEENARGVARVRQGEARAVPEVVGNTMERLSHAQSVKEDDERPRKKVRMGHAPIPLLTMGSAIGSI
ncbi:hypothetical protein JCM33374_g5205 [Metschnikowia sp. JCM 33374]|nr:hypothetical protein JCM33374_g5205 [Metschnikowia sp. JCM 33374]